MRALLIVFLSLIFPLLLISQSLRDSVVVSNFRSVYDSTLSNGVNVENSNGYVILKTSELENLAKGRKATITYYGTGAPLTSTGTLDTTTGNPMKVIDGDPRTFCQIRPGGDGSYIMIDLMAMRRINKVVIVTFGGNMSLRPRAYTIYVGMDSLQLTRIVQKVDNQDVKTIDIFDPILARYVKISFDAIDRFSSTVISEIEVYGVGYLPSGSYVSRVIDVGQDVNWGWATWEADLPEGTSVKFQFRTGSSAKVDGSWGQWSEEIEKPSTLNVSEPKRYIQFKANLSTSTTETPVLKNLLIFYDKKPVARNISVDVEPKVVQILKRSEVSLIFDIQIDDNSLGVDTLLIFTPSPASVEAVQVNGSPVAYSVVATGYNVKIAFPQTIKTSAKVIVKLSLTLYLDVNQFQTVFISKLTPDNPQFTDVKTVLTSDVPERLIVDLQVSPNPFSPNGDGLNDKVQISFFLANLNVERNLKIQIFDLTGKLIKTMFDGPSKAFAYISSNSFFWDGRDESGKVVRPGVYLLRVAIDSDKGVESIFKTVTVVY
jgi:hypothetical protein